MDIIDNLPKKFMREFTESGRELTLSFDEDKQPYLNLNTGMKSHLHLYYGTIGNFTGYYVNGRYGYQALLIYFADLHGAIIDSECGRGYMSESIETIYKNGFKDQWEKFE